MFNLFNTSPEKKRQKLRDKIFRIDVKIARLEARVSYWQTLTSYDTGAILYETAHSIANAKETIAELYVKKNHLTEKLKDTFSH